VVEFAARIPPKLKLSVLREKHILKEATRDLLPASIVRRPKQPYRAPDAEAFFGPGAPDYVEEALSPRALADRGFFDPRAVTRLADKCRRLRSVSTRDGMALVGILSTQLWAEAFLDGRPAQAAAAAPLRHAFESVSLPT
jgi:asparagine synthase (glutamine-hydrolysing)